MLLPEALHAPSHVGPLGAGHFVQCQGQWREQGVHDRAAALTVSSGVASRRQRPVHVRGTGAVTSVGCSEQHTWTSAAVTVQKFGAAQ